ncbi:MAG: hypothetical protein ACD_23C00998G0005 [uncultured bacterium]|jgi:hypothetical protein|nr:MAG: hypothetical protein ACD_23C00998G0005 [uncultured bacterium]
MSERKLPTNSLLTRAKREAKQNTTPDKPYNQALDEQAQLAGYPDWRTLAMANGLRNAHEGDDIPLDPVLPPNFDNTPNEDRSEKELDKWWDKPFILSRGDGSFEARALNGGAWDRSTCLGDAATVDEARTLARNRQKEWIEMRSEPVAYLRPDGLVDLIVMDSRPNTSHTVLASALRPEEVKAARERLKAGN